MDPVAVYLSDALARRIGCLTKLEEKVVSLTNKKMKLMALREDLMRRPVFAERQQMVLRNVVSDWLTRVEAVVNAVGEIEAQFQTRRSFLRACCPDCGWSSYKLGQKAVKTKAVVAELINYGKMLDNVADFSLPASVQMTTPSTSTVGNEQVMMRVFNYLKKEEVSIIGLYGMGGVGKTTLLQRIYNDLLRTRYFDVVIFLGVNMDPKPVEIQKNLIGRLGLAWSEDESPDRRAVYLHRILSNINYILLLDNIWERLDLNELGIPYPNNKNKCKLVFTTRSEEVCASMGAQRMIKIEVLSEVDAWNLFQEKVGDWVLDTPAVLILAKETAKMCGGVPRALIAVARAMANMKTLPEWRNAVQALRSSTRALEGMDSVFSILKYSYDCLPDDATKSCFLYCSFFPESWNIEMEDVIKYWIGEGFFYGIKSYTEAYDKGCQVLNRLKNASLLLESGGDDENRPLRMPDLVRDLGLRVASKVGKKGKSLLKSGVDGEWNEAETVFLLGQGLRVLPESPKCPNLSTLILEGNRDLKNVPETFFQNMHTLRVVNLSGTNISILPQSFSLLENMRYLNLSHTAIRELPKEIGRLIELQLLDLSHTAIRKLPKEIGQLIKLQHLDLSWTELESLPQELGGLTSLEHLNLQGTHSLQTIPHTTISKLSHLKELNFYDGFRNWELEKWRDDRIGVKLEELESLKHLRTLGITIENDHIFQRFFRSPFLLKCTKHLEIKNLEELSLKPLLSAGFAEMGVLQTLGITSCKRLEGFIVGSEVAENFLGCLHELHLWDLPNLNSICEGTMPQGCLGNLRSLRINLCHKLKSLGWVHHLPCLEDLYLNGCHEMKVISGDDEVMEDIIFPKLKKISLIDLPKLVSFYHRMLVFPSLLSLIVQGCPQLDKLPLDAHTARKLTTIKGEREWWEALEWKDEETKKALLPLYQRIS